MNGTVFSITDDILLMPQKTMTVTRAITTSAKIFSSKLKVFAWDATESICEAQDGRQLMAQQRANIMPAT